MARGVRLAIVCCLVAAFSQAAVVLSSEVIGFSSSHDVRATLQSRLKLRGSVVRPNSRAARDVKVVLYDASTDGKNEVVGTETTDRRGEFSFSAPVSRRYLVVAIVGDERGEVGPFELTGATAPVLIVLRRKK